MEMHQIRYFLAVCDSRNFTRAAQSVYVSQPSLTQAIKKLEDELGGELFLRDRSGCQLTALGRLVEPELRQIYTHALDTKAEAIRFTRLDKVPLRIGLMATIGAQRLSPFFANYQREYPSNELELIIDTEAALLQQLQGGSIDLVISAPIKPLGSHYRCEPLYEERYVVAFNRNHHFSEHEKIDLNALQSVPYLDRLNCELREQLKAMCNDRDINLYAAYRSNSEEWIQYMIGAGIGVALIPEFTLPANAVDISFRYLDEPLISRQLFAIYSGRGPQQGELHTMIRRLQQCL